MNATSIKVRLIGDRPLLMHSGRLADPLDDIVGDLAKITGKRVKTSADHEEIARVEWHGGLWLSGSRPCIPAEAVIGFDAQADAGRYHVTPGGVVVFPKGSPSFYARDSRDGGSGYQE